MVTVQVSHDHAGQVPGADAVRAQLLDEPLPRANVTAHPEHRRVAVTRIDQDGARRSEDKETLGRDINAVTGHDPAQPHRFVNRYRAEVQAPDLVMHRAPP